jgi:hypothetical protein
MMVNKKKEKGRRTKHDRSGEPLHNSCDGLSGRCSSRKRASEYQVSPAHAASVLTRTTLTILSTSS